LDVAQKNLAPMPRQADAADVTEDRSAVHDHRLALGRVIRREMRALPFFIPAPGRIDVGAHGVAMQREQEILVVTLRSPQRPSAKRARVGERLGQQLNPPGCHVTKMRTKVRTKTRRANVPACPWA